MLPSQGCYQGALLEVEQPGPELASTWDVGTCKLQLYLLRLSADPQVGILKLYPSFSASKPFLTPDSINHFYVAVTLSL